MPNVEVKVIYENATSVIPYASRFLKELKQPNENKLYCAVLEPPIPLNEIELLKYIHFSDFKNTDEKLTIVPEDKSIALPENIGTLTLKVIQPVPVPLFSSLNSKLVSERDQIFGHVFFLPHLKNKASDLEYLESINTKWEDLIETLRSTLTRSEKGTNGVSIGILETTDVLPIMKPIKSFFKTEKSYEQGQQVMIIIVSSFKHLTFRLNQQFVSIEKLPRAPKDIILRLRTDKSVFNATERRMIKVCLNGGVPVHFFDSPEIKIKKNDLENLKVSDFDQMELSLGNFDQIAGDILSKIEPFIEDLNDHLYSTSSEAAMQLIFWDPVINRMFQHGLEGFPKNFRLEPEWLTTSSFKEQILRKIDHVVTLQLSGKNYPIFLLEAGKEAFDLANPHKDQSKLLGVISQACIDLAYGLIAAHKKPESARTCGVWIGELTCQFIVAHPIITKLPDGEYEIHANISINPHWLFELTKPIGHDCTKLCCKESSENLCFESITKGNMNLEAREFLKETVGQFFDEPPLDEPASVTPSSTILKPVSNEKLIRDEINFKVLKIVNYFVQYAKHCINNILSVESDAPNEPRIFKDRNSFGIFDKSRESSTTVTPGGERLATASTKNLENSPLSKKSRKNELLESMTLKKNSMNELEILRKLSLYPTIFPVIYDYFIESKEEQVIIYEFEKMTMIYDPFLEEFSPLIKQDDPIKTLYGSLKFVLDCLYGLYVLHEVVGVIHSDISPNNIMYSELHRTWKFIDFNQSLEISESLKRPRIAGTEGYTAPESHESGIFTKESDVFSLGKVFVNIFDFMILHEICVNEDDEQITDEIRRIGHCFCQIIKKMIRTNPLARSKTLESLTEIFELTGKCAYFPDLTVYSSIRMLLRGKREIEQIQKNLGKTHFEERSTAEYDPKRPKISEEKEQAFTATQTIE